MKVGITGASGFLGRRVIERLRARGDELFALVRDVSRAPAGLAVRPADLSGEIGPAATEGLDAVVHLAAFLPPSYADAAHARACLEVNALGTLSLLRAAVASGVRAFVHTSTGNAYARQSRPVREDDPLYPSARATYYLASKLAGELYVDHVGRTSPIRAVVLRPSAIFGPAMAGGLVPTLTRRMLTREPVSLDAGGAYTADLVYVDDVADAVVSALASEGARGAYNVGAGRAATTREIAEALARLTGFDPEAITVTGDATPSGFSALDVSRARAELGYAPRPLDQGLLAYVASAR